MPIALPPRLTDWRLSPMATPEKARTCLVTGAHGYLGSRVKAAFEQRGWNVVELTRQPQPGTASIQFQLGRDVAASKLAGAQALVHCAYDFKELSWDAIHATNLVGSQKLLKAAHEAQIRTLIYISSISAYEGSRSLYGK